MQKERNLFFIKLSNNFYESDDLTALDDLIIEKELNPAYRYLAIVLYQKLLIKSLEYKGLISSDELLTASNIKKILKFRSGNGLEFDVKLINEVIPLFEELNLLTRQDKFIYMNKVKSFTSTSEDDYLEKIINNSRAKSIVKEIHYTRTINSSGLEHKEAIYNYRLENEFIPMLAVKNYCTLAEAKKYKYVFDELFDFGQSTDDIGEALKIFVQRVSKDDFLSKEHPEDYLSKTLLNIIRNDLKVGINDYDLLMAILENYKQTKLKMSERIQLIQMLDSLKNDNITRKDISKKSLDLIGSGTIQLKDLSFDEFVSVLNVQLKEHFK